MNKNMDELLDKIAINYDKGFTNLILMQNRINDEYVSAAFSTKGIIGLDYHGKQPVSRNAIILKGSYDFPAFRFVSDTPLSVSNYRASVFACQFSLIKDNDDNDINDINESNENNDKEASHNSLNKNRVLGYVEALAYKKSIFMKVSSNKENERIDLEFDEASLFTKVHGNRVWQKIKEEKDANTNIVTYKASNKYKLRDWLDKNKAYLLLVKDQAEIFGTNPLIDVNNLDHLPPINDWVKGSDKLFIDCEIYMTVYKQFGSSKINNENTSYFCIAFGDSYEESRSIGDFTSDNYTLIKDELLLKYESLYTNTPSLDIDNHEGAKNIFSLTPSYVKSAKDSKTGMTRASASSYYWVWGWDNIASAMEMGSWSDLKGQKDIIDFISKNLWKDYSVPHRYDRNYDIIQTMHFSSIDSIYITLVCQYIFDSQDDDYLYQIYPTLKHIWKGLLSKSHKNGYIIGPGFYPDDRHALGRRENSYTAMETGTFYTATRLMEILAGILEDYDTKKEANKIHNLIEETYIKDFYSSEVGGLVDSIYDDGKKNITFPLYAYMGAYTNFGYNLFFEKLDKLGDYIFHKHLLFSGIRVLPEDDVNKDTESVHYSWYSHWDFYALSLIKEGFFISNKKEESSNLGPYYLKLLDGIWDKFKAAIEVVDCDSDKDKIQWQRYGQAWNCNCATGILRAIRQGVCGITSDFGTLSVLADGSSKANLKSFSIRKGLWDIENVGDDYLSYIEADKKKFFYTCLVPDEFMTKGNHNLKVVNQSKDLDFKIYKVIGARLKNYIEEERKISFTLEARASLDLVIYSKSEFELRIIEKDEVTSKEDKENKVIKKSSHRENFHKFRLESDKDIKVIINIKE